MTKKALDEQKILNELKGNSAFFPGKGGTPLSGEPSKDHAAPSVIGLAGPEEVKVDTFQGDRMSPPQTRPQAVAISKGNTSQRREHDTTVSRHRDTASPQYPNTLIETIRKAVKQLGKEAATHRFTVEEKRALRGIVYTYETQGVKTSENEIARIAIHSVLEDYQVNNENSVLARVLERLNS